MFQSFPRSFAWAAAALILLLTPLTTDLIAAPIVAVTPPSQTVGLGGLFEVEIRISGLGAGLAPSLGSYDFGLNYDPSLVSFTSEAYGDSVLGNQLDLFSLGSLQFTTLSGGLVELFEISFDSAADLDSLQASEFTLVRAQFMAIGPGTASFALFPLILGDSLGNGIETLSSPAGVMIVATPEPSALLLLTGGLLAAFAARRRLA